MKTIFRKRTAAWPLVIFLLLPTLTHAETAVQAWVQRFNGPGSGTSRPNGLAVDSGDNVIVTGYSLGSGGSYDYATVKYSSAGVPLWTNFYDGPVKSLDYANAMALDGSNNVIVTGESTGSGSGYDYATIKYSSAGVPLWTNRYNGPGNGDDYAMAMAVDGSNNVIVAGQSVGSGSGYDYATIKYSSAGVPLWTNRYNGPGNTNDYAEAMAVDSSNNVIVTGESTGSGSGYDYATIKYSSAGVPLWTNRYDGPGSTNDYAAAIVVDGSNDVIVTGHSTGSGSGYDAATIKYSSAGVPLWTNLYNGPANGNDYASALAVDGSNSVIVTGLSWDGVLYDYATIKYSSAGVPLWTNRYNQPGSYYDQVSAVVVDASNNVIVTGSSTTSEGYYVYTTIKYSATGAPLWTNLYNGPANYNVPTAMALDHSGNVIVTGYSTGSGGKWDFATVKYICVPEPVLTGLQPTNGTFQLRVDGVLRPGTLVIEACTNLAGWAPVFTNTTPTNVVFYTDPNASNAPTRFYRAFQFP